jgi:uncharacterized protein YaaN involved in tellurite resistance
MPSFLQNRYLSIVMTSGIKLSKLIFENVPSQELLKVFAGFLEDLLKGELTQFQNYGKKLTRKQLLELVKTGKIENFQSEKSKIISTELENFKKVLQNAKFHFAHLNEFSQKIEEIIALIDEVKPALESDNAATKEYAYQLVYKFYTYIERLKSMYVDASVQFNKKLPSDFKPSFKKEPIGGSEQVQITQVMNKPGLIRSVLKKLVQEGFYTSLEAGPAISHLNKMVKELSVKK